MKKSSAIEAVSETGWLSQVPQGFRDSLLRHCQLLEMRDGTLLYDHGSDGGSLYGVAAGRIGITLPVDLGGSCLVHIGGPGFWTGNVAAFTDLPRQVGVVVMEQSWLLNLPASALGALVTEDPANWRWLAMLSSVNLAAALETIENLATADPGRRVAKVLLRLWKYRAGTGAQIPVTQTELAMMARLSRSAVNAALGRLVEAGAVAQSYGVIDILSPEQLNRIARGD